MIAHYMSGGIQPCNITFRGPNGFAAGVAAQHSQDYVGPKRVMAMLPLLTSISQAGMEAFLV